MPNDNLIKQKALLSTLQTPEKAARFFINKAEQLEKKPNEENAKEALLILAPLADRLGMAKIRRRLEDISFPFLYPKEAAAIRKKLAKNFTEREKTLFNLKTRVEEFLEKNGLICQLQGRVKSAYSIFKKLQKYEGDFGKINDLIALRLIVPEIPDCYLALGLIHQLFAPLPNTIKDYIAKPKLNGYKSLHTTVILDNKRLAEFQIRTEEMDRLANFGQAAHWYYSQAVSRKEKAEKRILAPKEKKSVFVQTPKGDILELAAGATALDFAYKVHTQVGAHAFSILVNAKIAPLEFPLKNGDVVEVLTRPRIKPSHDWLKKIRTSHARDVIRHQLKDNIR
ncbi:bifunctional (p)ppGpp synthetase/guanosine-3',5'-bis(diphosphate) 3'-pyrophosphohydrolase [Candidatus Berkelbacteria bacterium]|nr:bifunctional (p)ppGpp synthetase/guanosine-3',5'-bis(diphosphate) 3'-pyrophosphohydrolase [Candidatus Berkelbacteria bacterium]